MTSRCSLSWPTRERLAARSSGVRYDGCQWPRHHNRWQLRDLGHYNRVQSTRSPRAPPCMEHRDQIGKYLEVESLLLFKVVAGMLNPRSAEPARHQSRAFDRGMNSGKQLRAQPVPHPLLAIKVTAVTPG
jgi:hypothetical protein